MRSALLALFMVLSLGLLAGCESAEQKAEKHYQSALALLEAGDEERAIIEFKNVFKLNGRHKAARIAYADLQRRRGNLREAIAQNLLIAEQFPDDVDSRRKIAEMYAEIGNWREMARFAEEADALAPDDPAIDALQVVHAYRQKIEENDPAAMAEVVARARALIGKLPENMMLRRVVIDDLIRREAFEEALAELDAAIAIAPDDHGLYVVRLPVLGALGDGLAVERQLKEMIRRFPEDKAAPAALIRWYIAQGQLDEAEAFLRKAVETGGTDERLSLISFLDSFRGRAAALAELDRMAAGPQADPALLGLRAGYRFDSGERDEAIADLRALLDGMEPSDDQRKLMLVLAEMLEGAGDADGARALVDQVLAGDGTNAEALKKKAGWLIGEDRTGDAILLLRRALESAPRDPEVLTLLARAHAREGNTDLVGEMLALAYDAANSAPEETLRYARYLIERGSTASAEGILVDALRLAPDNVDLLSELGTLHVARQDWPRAIQVRDRLYALDSELAVAAGNNLTNMILQGQNRTDEAVAFLQELVEAGAASFGANVEIVRSFLSAGEPEKARAHVDRLLAESPDDIAVRFLDASLDGALGANDSAADKYRAILSEDSAIVQGWVGLYRVLRRAGRIDEARAVADEALAAVPDEPVLKWMKAGVLEETGQIDAAIALYEEMYAADSENLVIANNLASLMSNARTDPDTLERAGRIARRLRGSDFPPYQDTYGWIALLRGEMDEALPALEAAAAGLPEDPQVQYHLGRAYLAADRRDAALAQFRKVLALAGDGDARDFVADARAQLQALSGAAPAEAGQ